MIDYANLTTKAVATNASQAYARICGNVRQDSKPMPHWDDIDPKERELLTKMFALGIEHACAVMKEKLDGEPL